MRRAGRFGGGGGTALRYCIALQCWRSRPARQHLRCVCVRHRGCKTSPPACCAQGQPGAAWRTRPDQLPCLALRGRGRLGVQVRAVPCQAEPTHPRRLACSAPAPAPALKRGQGQGGLPSPADAYTPSRFASASDPGCTPHQCPCPCCCFRRFCLPQRAGPRGPAARPGCQADGQELQVSHSLARLLAQGG